MKRLSGILAFIALTFFFAHAAYPAAVKDGAPPKEAASPAKGAAAQDQTKPASSDKKNEKKEETKKEEKKDVKTLINMVYVKGGCFDMGDFTGRGDDDEAPVHEVCVSDYYIADSEVTQELWYTVMGFKYAAPYEPDKPVVEVTFPWLSRFLVRLNQVEKRHFRLPTEAEWEYAAREGGKKIRWSGTDDESELKDYAWYEENSDAVLHPVKQKKPNKLGLYDMTGNAWEWVDDFFDFDYYKTSPRKDPFGPSRSLWRTVRGASMLDDPARARTTYRYALEPDQGRKNLGFRIAE